MSARGRGDGDRGRGGARGGGDSGRGRGDAGGRGGYSDASRGGGGRGGVDRFAPLELTRTDVTTLKPITTADYILPHNFGARRAKMAEKASERPKENTVEARELERNKAATARAAVMDAMKNVQRLPPGVAGSETKVATNFFAVNIAPATSVYQYDIVIEPDVPNPRARKVIVEELMRPLSIPTTLSGGKIVFAAKELHAKGTTEHVIEHKPSAGARGWRAREIKLRLRFSRALANPPNGVSTELFTVYNSAISNTLSGAGFVRLSGKYFDFAGTYTPPTNIEMDQRGDPQQSLRLSGGLSLVMHPTQRGLLMAADLAFRVSRKDTMLHFIETTRALFKADSQKQIDEGLLGVIGVSTYLTGSRKNTFVVSKVRHDLTPASVIPDHPEKITFATYLKNNYGLTVRPNQPMLEFEHSREKDQNGAPKKTYFVPELCIFAGQSESMRANTVLQQQLKRHLIKNPQERFTQLVRLMEKVFSATGKVAEQLRTWGISLVPKLLDVPGRVLGEATITHAGGKPLHQRQHAWLLKPVPIDCEPPKKWAVIHPANADPRPFIDSLINEQINQLTSKKWTDPTWIIRYDSRRGRQALSDALDELEEDTGFFLVCLAGMNDEFYELVKHRALQEWNIPNQCVLMKNFTPNPMKPTHLSNVTSRVAGQMLVKCGASLWLTKINVPTSTMIVGIDVARSTKGAMGASVALVACNGENGAAVFSKEMQDVAGDRGRVVRQLLAEALKAFETKTKKPAVNVIVYRPGAHEGDIVEVVQDEVMPLKKAMGPGQKLAFVISLKSAAVRCHPAPSGLVLDQHVVSPYGFSFYIVPQVVNMGTATAMKYSLLANEVFTSGAQLEEVTWSLCHMFYGWWGTTREPSVVMYATRAADLHSRLELRKPLATGAALTAL